MGRSRSTAATAGHRPDSRVATLPLEVDTTTRLRPFFGFYGGKWRDTPKHYPRPKHKMIIEPFAGSAGYATRYWKHQVILCEVDPVIAGIWEYLVSVSEKEILSIPDLLPGQSTSDLRIAQEARWLVGFWLNRGTARPRPRPSKWMREKVRPGSFWGERVRNTIASQLQHIRHWKIHHCSYEECPVSRPATWFIDPPYQHAGKYYSYGSSRIRYDQLGSWCRRRKGQVIVCENDGADWLPFRSLATLRTTRSAQSCEVIWTKDQ